MEMLMSTDANIVAFEPHPANYKLLSATISMLDQKYQNRVALFPVGLGSETSKSQIFSGKGNMGNSVIGKPLKDTPDQETYPPVDIFIERLDSILSDNIAIPLMKMDAQGLECQILDGLSSKIAHNIGRVKFEYAQKWLDGQGCTDLLPKFRSFGFTITHEDGNVTTLDALGCGICDLYALQNLHEGESALAVDAPGHKDEDDESDADDDDDETDKNDHSSSAIFPDNAVKQTRGNNGQWEMIHYSDYLALADTCNQVVFNSTTGNSAKMCVHTDDDFLSRVLRDGHRWWECDALSRYWNGRGKQTTDETDDREVVYVEIGANVGSCVMEMLMSTDANIVAFEPHPANYKLLSATISMLDQKYQNRVALFPVGLGSETSKSQIFSGKGNMGNSVIGKPLKDTPDQETYPPVDIFIERLDSILSDNIAIPLMKMDAQGLECQILDGLSSKIAHNIGRVKFEYAQKWLDGQGCTDLLPKFRSFGFTITHADGNVTTLDALGCGICDLYALK